MLFPSTYTIDSSGILFEQQPPFKYCGHFQIRAMLNYYKQQMIDYQDCCTSRFAKNFGLMHPNELAQTLTYRDLPSKHIITTDQPIQERINYLKGRLLDTQGPHVIMLARLYNAQGNQSDTWIRRLAYHHYVSVRGYNDKRQEIYLYDSTRTKFPQSDQLPTGNFALPYEYFLHCRKRGGFQLQNFSLVSIFN